MTEFCNRNRHLQSSKAPLESHARFVHQRCVESVEFSKGPIARGSEEAEFEVKRERAKTNEAFHKAGSTRAGELIMQLNRPTSCAYR